MGHESVSSSCIVPYALCLFELRGSLPHMVGWCRTSSWRAAYSALTPSYNTTAVICKGVRVITTLLVAVVVQPIMWSAMSVPQAGSSNKYTACCIETPHNLHWQTV
jgi:hypothetical protein